MYEKLIALKEDKKWLYYILFIPIIILSIYELYSKYLVNSSKNIIKNAEEVDKVLEKEQIKAEQGSKFHEEKAEQIKEQIKNQKIDKDWYLK